MASGSSIGVNSTIGNDLPSLTISDDFPADYFQDLDFSSVYGNCSLMKSMSNTNGSQYFTFFLLIHFELFHLILLLFVFCFVEMIKKISKNFNL